MLTTTTPRASAAADGLPRVGADDQVVADRASRRCRGRSGRWAGWVAERGGRAPRDDARRPPERPDRAGQPREIAATRGRPARSSSTDARPAGHAAARSARRSARPGPPRSRATPGRRARARPATGASSRPMTSSPSAPPSSAATGSKDAAIGRPGKASVLTYGRLASTRSNGPETSPAAGPPRAKRDRVARPHGRPRSRGRGRARRPRCRRPGSRPRRAHRAGAAKRRARPRWRHSPSRHPRSGSAGRRPLRMPEPSPHLGLRQLDEAFRLRPRDQGTRVDGECEPVELLDPADVGDRLAGRAALDAGSIARGGIGPDRRLGMGEDHRAADPDRVAEQQLGVEPRASRSRPLEGVRRLRAAAAPSSRLVPRPRLRPVS